MRVALIFAALFAVASAGVLTSGPAYYASAPIAYQSAPLIRSAPVLAHPQLAYASPVLSKTVVGSPYLAHAPVAYGTHSVLAGPTIIG